MIEQHVQGTRRKPGNDQRCLHRREPCQRDPPAAHGDSPSIPCSARKAGHAFAACLPSPNHPCFLHHSCPISHFEGYRILSKSCQDYTGQAELARRAANELGELWMPAGSVCFNPQRAFNTIFTPAPGQGWRFLLSILGSVGSVTAAASQQQNTAPTMRGSSSMDKSQPGAAPSLGHLQLFLWRGCGTGFLPFCCCLQLRDTDRTAAASPTSLNHIQPGKLTRHQHSASLFHGVSLNGDFSPKTGDSFL